MSPAIKFASVDQYEVEYEQELKIREPAAQRVTWIKQDVSAERRAKLRSRAAFEVELRPLDDNLEPTGKSQPATILNFSTEGVCLEHHSLIPEQYVSISWFDSTQLKHVAVIKLKWCRSTDNQKILSGGRVSSMETIS